MHKYPKGAESSYFGERLISNTFSDVSTAPGDRYLSAGDLSGHTMMSYTSTSVTHPGPQIATLASSGQNTSSPSRRVTTNSQHSRIVGGNISPVMGASTPAQIASVNSVQQAGSTRNSIGSQMTPSMYAYGNNDGVHYRYDGAIETTQTRYGADRILREEVVEHEIKVPKKVIVEETIEKVVVIPEKIVREEVIEETQMVRERIIEIAKPIFQEKIVEVPEYQYVDKIIEVPQTIIQEKIREVPKVEYVEHVTYVPKIIQQEKIVQVPEIEYREYAVEKIVEVPEVHTEVKIIEKPIPQYVDVPVPNVVDVQVVEDVERQIPVPVEAVTTVEYRLPQFRSRYEKVPMPIYVPRFVEVAIPSEQMDDNSVVAARHAVQQVEMAAMSGAPSLCELETLAERVKKFVPEMNNDADAIRDRLARLLPESDVGTPEQQIYAQQYIKDRKKYSDGPRSLRSQYPQQVSSQQPSSQQNLYHSMSSEAMKSNYMKS